MVEKTTLGYPFPPNTGRGNQRAVSLQARYGGETVLYSSKCSFGFFVSLQEILFWTIENVQIQDARSPDTTPCNAHHIYIMTLLCSNSYVPYAQSARTWTPTRSSQISQLDLPSPLLPALPPHMASTSPSFTPASFHIIISCTITAAKRT